MIHEPQDAAAAGICWLARWGARGRLHGTEAATFAAALRHPRECGWCSYPMPALMDWLQDFNRRDIGNRMSARFRLLPTDAQRALVDRSLYSEGVPA